MDVNGDGQLDATKWAGAQDGVLVWDKYHDGQVHDHTQYAFAQYDTGAAAQGRKATDLSGLAAKFDSNHDGVFDARDAQFADFNVWQDANQNGVSDAGEVKSLAELGLASFNLTSDGVARNPEAGVHEAGRTSALTADGAQVMVADVGFDFSTLAPFASAAIDSAAGRSGLVGRVDLGADAAANALRLNLSDVLAIPSHTLLIEGDANDSVQLQGMGWVKSGTVATQDDQPYTLWQNEMAQVLIAHNLVSYSQVL
jgi:hypothetical protein